MWITITIFILTYFVLCIGRLPGLKIDRTGAVVVGALAMIVLGSISSKDAWNAINYETVGMLFGLMVLSSSFLACGFYDWFSNKIANLRVSSPILLAIFIISSGLLSAVLTNDVVVVAMTPILISITLSRGLNPTPFLLGFCFASNTVPTFSLIGSPQNIIVAQELHLSFLSLMMATIVPALLSIFVIWGVLVWLYKGKWELKQSANAIAEDHQMKPLNKPILFKATLIAVLVIVAFLFTSISHEVIAFGAAALLLLNHSISSSDILKNVDGSLMLLIMGLFVVNAGFSETGLSQQMMLSLKSHHIDMHNPIILFLSTSVISDIVGNSPAVMLLMPFLTPTPEIANSIGTALALGTGISSNLFIFCSLTGIITVEQAKLYKVNISFSEFTRSGALITAISMIICVLNLFVLQFFTQ